MVEVVAKAEFPGFKMEIRTHEFHLTEKLTNDIRNYVMGIGWTEWDSYNLFDHEEDCIKELAKVLHNEVCHFNHNAEKRNDLWINGWVNILYKNDSIKPHWHSAEKKSYYSCNVCLDNYESHTIFYPPWGDRNGHIITQKNTKGSGMFFPPWLWHEVPPISDPIRYTIGLDIHTDESMKDHDKNAPISRSRRLHEVYS